MLGLEVRTFEQRFGKRCPFCGEPWSSEKSCGPNKEYTIQQSLKLLFADRTTECLTCGRSIPNNRKHCWDCARQRELALGRDKAARYRERHQIAKVCNWCGSAFNTHKGDQRYCSLSCGNRARGAKRGS